MGEILARSNLKTVSEAKLHATELAKALEPKLDALLEQARYQSQALHAISEQLAQIAAKG